jgi:hypothetical protein
MDDDNIGSNPGTPPYDNADDARGVTGTWGGLVVLGRTYVANNTTAGPNAAREVQIEGLTSPGGLGLYGNCAASALYPSNCDDDDSGTLEYVSIRYGGYNLSLNNEINGLTLGAVGRETDIRNVEVFQNKDDAIEFFGGTVGVKNAVLVAPGDDSLDWDEGYRGKVQFVLAVQGTPGTDKSDKGGELDGVQHDVRGSRGAEELHGSWGEHGAALPGQLGGALVQQRVSGLRGRGGADRGGDGVVELGEHLGGARRGGVHAEHGVL